VHGSPTLLEALSGVLFLFYALCSIMPVSAPVREVGSAWLLHATSDMRRLYILHKDVNKAIQASDRQETIILELVPI